MKNVAISVALLTAIALSGCSASNPSHPGPSPEGKNEPALAEQSPVAPDLTGEWKQRGSHSETDFMTATIAEGTIVVNWELQSQNMTALFWAGTFEAPDSAIDPFSWESQRDIAVTESALMASTDDTKKFTYRDGVLSFDVSIQDNKATVELTKD